MPTVEYFFPTMIFSDELSSAEIQNATILNLIYAQRAHDPDGIIRSNYKGLGGWHSKNDLHLDGGFQPMVDVVQNMATHINKNLGYDFSKSLYIESMWAIINSPGSLNKSHVHAHSLWSGVYYVQTPENCGNIEFIDPRTEAVMNEAVYQDNQSRPKPCWSNVKYVPKSGKILIFPSWLYHSTQPNLSTLTGKNSDRVIISFNLNQR